MADDSPIVPTLAQLRLLGSPVRQEVFFTLGRVGPCGVGKLARALGTAPSSVYYHVHALVAGGLVEDLGEHAATTRPERHYRAKLHVALTLGERRSRAYRKALRRFFEAGLEGVAKRVGAFVDAAGELRGADRFLSRAYLVRLSEPAASEVRRRLQELDRFVQAEADGETGDLYSIHITHVPLDES